MSSIQGAIPQSDATPPGSGPIDPPGVLLPMLGGVSGLLEPSRLMAEMATKFGCEALRLASRRLRAQAEFLDALARCRNVRELTDQQLDFVRRAGSDYSAEFTAMLQPAQPQPQSPSPDRTAMPPKRHAAAG